MSSEPVAVSSRSLAPEDGEAGPLLVHLPPTPFVAPEHCACCGGAPTAWRALRAGGGREISIGYCADCALHAARLETRKLAAWLAAILIGTALALALPIAWPWLSLTVTIALSVAGVLLPLFVVALGGRAPAGHAARGPAVWLAGPDTLIGARPAWARELAARVSNTPVRAPRARALPLLEIALVALVAGAMAPLSHAFQHPWIRILNLGDTTLHVRADGHDLGLVEPSSMESPLAGLDVRIPAGQRLLLSRAPGEGPVLSDAVHVEAGKRHLYAPIGAGTCFWLERTTYGRERASAEKVPLVGGPRFWVIPEDVQGWFVSSPSASADVRATGGTATVLRQGPCEPTR